MTTIHQPQQKQQESLPSANVDTTSTANSIIIHLSNKEETRNNNKTVTPTTITTSKLTSDIIPSNLIPVSTITINIDNNHNDDSIIYDPLALASLVSSLNKDGSGKIILTFSSTATGSDSTLISSIHTSIVLAGLIAQSEKITENGIGCITAVYKNNVNTTRNGNKSSSQPLKINLSAASNISNNNNNGGDNDDELIDEDELLSSNINYNNPTDIDVTKRQKELNDCGGRKACDNCTCGRKEMEAMESGNGSVITSTAKEKVNLKSSCGNCAKGDAFRCAGCPFLGKPAFKEGEEHLVLDLTDDL